MRRATLFASALVALLATYWRLAAPPKAIEWEWEAPKAPSLTGEEADKAVKLAAQALTYRILSAEEMVEDGGDGSHLSDDSKEQLRKLHSFLREKFPVCFTRMEVETVNEWSLLMHWPGADKEKAPVLLLSHVDVVPPGNESLWSVDPFGGAIKDGYIYGRGALDTRLTALAILESLEKAAKEGWTPERSIYVAFGHDEEVGGGAGAKKVAEVLSERGIHFELVLDEGGSVTTGTLPIVRVPVALIGVAEKGSYVLKVTLHGAGGHTSAPMIDGSDTPSIAGRVISDFQKKQMSPRMTKPIVAFLEAVTRFLPAPLALSLKALLHTNPGGLAQLLSRVQLMNPLVRTTNAVTVGKFGDRINVIPNQADIYIHYRPLPGESISSVLEHTRSVVEGSTKDFSIDVLETRNPSGDSYLPRNFELVEQCIVEIFGNHSNPGASPSIMVSPYITIGGTDSRYYEKLSNGGVFKFSPMVLNAQTNDFSRIHGLDERISIQNYLLMIDFYSRFVELSAGT